MSNHVYCGSPVVATFFPTHTLALSQPAGRESYSVASSGSLDLIWPARNLTTFSLSLYRSRLDLVTSIAPVALTGDAPAAANGVSTLSLTALSVYSATLE